MTYLDLMIEGRDIVAALNEPEGADSDVLDPALSAWLDAVDDKLGAYHVVIERLAAEDALLDAVAKKIAAKRATLKKQHDSVRGRATDLLLTMEAAGEEPKVKRPEFTAYLSRSESVSVDPDAVLPADLVRVVTSPDKAAIKAVIKGGHTVPGCAILESRAVVFR
jgi:hypothetical protein